MKPFPTFLRTLLLLPAAALLFACQEPGIDGPGGPGDPGSQPSGDIPVESVRLDITARELLPGEILQLTATLLPQNATNKDEHKLVWNSSAPGVAKVSDTGLVTALVEGSATISVSFTADIMAFCEITVTTPKRVEGIVKSSDFGLSGESTADDRAAGNDYSYRFAPRAALVSEEAMRAVDDVWTDGHMYRFSLPSTRDPYYGNSSSVNTDDILVFRDCEAFPGGAAIKIVHSDAAQNSTGTAERFSYEGYQVPIEEVFQSMHMETSQLNLGEIRRIEDEEGKPVAYSTTRSGGGFEIAIPELFGEDFTAALNLGDNLTITPKMRISFNMDLAADVVDFKVTYARCRVEADADLSCDLSFKATVQKEFKTKRLTIFLGAIPIGPVVISPVITMDFMVKLSGQVDLTFSVAYQKSVFAHAFYNGANLQCRVGEKAPSDPKDPFSVTGSMSGAVEFGPNLGMGVSLYGGALALGVDFDPHLVYTVFSAYPISIDSFRGILNGTYGTDWLSYAGYEPSLAFTFGGYIQAAYAWSLDFKVPEEMGLSYSFGKTYVVPQLADEVSILPGNGRTTFSARLKNKTMYLGDMYMEVREGDPTAPPQRVPFTISGTPGNKDGEEAACTAELSPSKEGVRYYATGPFMTISPLGYKVDASLTPNKFHLYNQAYYLVDRETEDAVRAILSDLYACRQGNWEGCNWFDKDVPFYALQNVTYQKYSDAETAEFKAINPAFFQNKVQIFIPDGWEMGGSLSIGEHTGRLNDMGWELYLPPTASFSAVTIEDPNLADVTMAPSRAVTIHAPRLGRFNGGFSIPDNNPQDAVIDLSGTGIPFFNATFRKDGAEVPFTGALILDRCDSLKQLRFSGAVPRELSFRDCKGLKRVTLEDVEDAAPLAGYKGKTGLLTLRNCGASSGTVFGGDLLFEHLSLNRVPVDIVLDSRNDLVSVSYVGCRNVSISHCPSLRNVTDLYSSNNSLSPSLLVQDLTLSDCPELGLPYTDADGSRQEAHPYFIFHASQSVSVSQCPEIVEISVTERATKKVHLSDCRKLRGIYLGHIDDDSWTGDLEDLSVTDCPALGDVTIHSSKLNGEMPAFLQKALHHWYFHKPAFPRKYYYRKSYVNPDNPNGEYRVSVDKTYPNGYYMPGEPSRPYDYFQTRYYDEDEQYVR